ncbi:HEAT repeat domain-containing protein [Streptomyces sp. NPDC020965]|uniref:HEAT repeat domain-containing protein n=1 Tax=Streptomyces sp. NPDC020965 TaxID=3365105 RepID=UPI0037B16ACE
MTAYGRLIQEALAAEATPDTERTERAVRALAAAGPDALRHVLTVADEQADRHHPALYEVVRRGTYPEAVPVLIPHAGSVATGVVESVLHALARSGEDEGPAFVVARLTDRAEPFLTRAAASAALQGVSDTAAGDALREVLAEQRGEPDEPEWPLLLVNTATALAMMNDHSGATALYPLFAAGPETGRSLAVAAFRLVLDEDTPHQLSRALDDPSAEVRAAAVDPLFLIGSPTAARLLLRRAAEDGDPQVRQHALIRFGDIMGLVLNDAEDLPFAREKWEERGEGLDPAVCHRFGGPVTLGDLVEEFTEEATLRAGVAEELRLLTGVDVPAVLARDGLEAARRSVRDVPFTAGRIHKWGHAQPMPPMPPPG